MHNNHLQRLILGDNKALVFWLDKARALLADPQVEGEMSPLVEALKTHAQQSGEEAKASLRKNVPEFLEGWNERVLYTEMFCSAIDSTINDQCFEAIALRLLEWADDRGETS